MVQAYMIKDRSARDKIGSDIGEELDNELKLINDKFGQILDVSVSGNMLYVEPSTKTKLESDGSDGTQDAYKWRLPVISAVDIATVASSLDLASGSTTGDFTYATDPGVSVTAGYYIQMGVYLDTATKKLNVVWGSEASSLAATGAPAFPTSDCLQILVAKLHNNGTAGVWKFLTPAKSDIEIVKGSIPGGGSAGANAIPVLAEVPLEVANGSNTVFNASYVPYSTMLVFVDGVLKYKDVQYSRNEKVVTFTSPPDAGSDILFVYGTLSPIVQQAVANGDNTTTSFRINLATPAVGLLDGLASIPGTESQVFGNILKFASAPGTGQRICLISGNLGNISQNVLSGTVDGSNRVFTIPATPAGDAFVFLNGLYREQGSGAGKCVVNGATVTFGTAPMVGQVPYAVY